MLNLGRIRSRGVFFFLLINNIFKYSNEEFDALFIHGFVLIFKNLELLEYSIPHYSPTEFYEMDKKEVLAIRKTLFNQGIFDSFDINLL